jgi:signal transduction histidine kinase
VDVLLYRDYYDLGRTVQRFSQSLATVRDQPAVVTSLLDDLCDTLNLSGAALLQLPGGLDPAILQLLEPDDLFARREYLPLDVRRQLVRELGALSPAVLMDSFREPVVLAPFAGCAALVVIGPGSGGDMSALLLIGAKRGGGQLRAEDRMLLGTVAHQAATALENSTLIGGLRTTLVQLRHSTEQLEDARAELKLLLREMVDADERQRASLARDIHDVALQDLMFVGRSASYCVKLFGAVQDGGMRVSADAPRLAKELAELSKVAASAEVELRNVISGLYPAMLESLGLPSALETLADEVSPSHALTITVAFDPEAEELAGELDKDVRLHMYRIAQEAIRNACKHAQASNVQVDLRMVEATHRTVSPERRSPAASLTLAITDDGAGIPLPVDYVGLLRDRHLGLASMRDRADRMGGHLAITSHEGGGTRIEVRLQLQRDADAPSGWAPISAPPSHRTPLLAIVDASRSHMASAPARRTIEAAIAGSTGGSPQR